MIKIKIMFVSFLTMFFVIHPVNSLCSENCLISALLFSTIFSFLNINIYRYVKGDEFDILSGYAYTIKPNTDPLIRFLWFFSLIIANILVIYLSIKLSWIFN
ncbi:hypothetical protein BSPLISOX_1578 [uncultured Gammaproteobacteria bacterium]|jgi:hypothetical protein|nr:hypothetical protein BSPLISOX_1578 [uncultured Gammaproteobacteria bacterium]